MRRMGIGEMRFISSAWPRSSAVSGTGSAKAAEAIARARRSSSFLEDKGAIKNNDRNRGGGASFKNRKIITYMVYFATQNNKFPFFSRPKVLYLNFDLKKSAKNAPFFQRCQF